MHTIQNARTRHVAKRFLITMLAAAWLGGCAVDGAELSAPEESGEIAASPEALADIEATQKLGMERLQAAFEESQKTNAVATAAAFPELNGLRVKVPGQPHIYLIDRGVRRHIPNPDTFNRLFRNWEGIQENGFYALIEVGAPISTEAQLVRGAGRAEVFLIEPYSKRWISSPAAMDRYNFRWESVWQVPRFMLDPIQTGSQID